MNSNYATGLCRTRSSTLYTIHINEFQDIEHSSNCSLCKWIEEYEQFCYIAYDAYEKSRKTGKVQIKRCWNQHSMNVMSLNSGPSAPSLEFLNPKRSWDTFIWKLHILEFESGQFLPKAELKATESPPTLWVTTLWFYEAIPALKPPALWNVYKTLTRAPQNMQWSFTTIHWLSICSLNYSYVCIVLDQIVLWAKGDQVESLIGPSTRETAWAVVTNSNLIETFCWRFLYYFECFVQIPLFEDNSVICVIKIDDHYDNFYTLSNTILSHHFTLNKS